MDSTISAEHTPLVASSSELDPAAQLTGCGGSALCDPRKPFHRYFVLIFICFLSFGSYYVYDNPAALQDVMIGDLHIDTQQFTNLYAVYSYPNVILCCFGGFLIDRVFGIRLGALIFCLLVTIGQASKQAESFTGETHEQIPRLSVIQLVFAFGAFINAYWLMLVGRLIFGMGGENLGVAQNTYAVGWFKGRELNMVFGLQLSFSRVGSTVNMNTMRPIYESLRRNFHFANEYQGLGITLFIGGAFCLLSVFCACMMFYFDRRAQRILQKDEVKTGEKIKLSDVKDFGAKFWMICIICVAYYVTVFPFISLALVFFENKYELTASQSASVNSVVYIISAIASPLCGFGIDRLGKNIFWLLFGVVVTILSHGIMAFTFINPFVPMVMMGVAYSMLASALWPLVAYVIPKNQIATAYGIMQSIQNLGLAVSSNIIGLIVDSKGYITLELINLAWLCVALIAGVALYLVDYNTGGVLNLSAGQRKRIAEEKAATLTASREPQSIDT